MTEKPDVSRPPGETGEGDGASATKDGTDGDWACEVQTHYDPSEEIRDLTAVIVGTVAEAEGVSITEVGPPPLHEAVDVVNLEGMLFGRHGAPHGGTESSVEFRYGEYRVTVEANGWVTVAGRADIPPGEE
jgi:hypothetical protein